MKKNITTDDVDEHFAGWSHDASARAVEETLRDLKSGDVDDLVDEMIYCEACREWLDSHADTIIEKLKRD